MYSFLRLVIVFCIVSFSANAEGWKLFSGVRIHTGFIATRASTPVLFDGTNKFLQSRSCHVFRADATRFQIGVANWFANGSEGAGGGTLTTTAGIEYPTNILTQVTFSNSASTVIASGSTATSDFIYLTVTSGSIVCVRIWQQGSVGTQYAGTPINTVIGDVMNIGTTLGAVPDQTMSGVITGNTANILTPLFIIGQTTKASPCFVGDSRAWGLADTPDISGDVGDIARSIGSQFGYMVSAASSTRGSSFVSGSTRRIALFNLYCTHFINEHGGADVAGGDSAATVEAMLRSLWALPAIKVYNTTMEPITTTSNGCTTLGGQTLPSYSPVMVAVNDYIRTTPSPLIQFFEVANVIATSSDTRFWLTPGVSVDCLHETQAGYLMIPAANAIPINTFSWPYLLNRDLGAANDNTPAFIDKAA